MTGNWKDSFVASTAQAVLNGEVARLDGAFFWCVTPEGHAFWQSQRDNGALSDQGRERLQEMLKEYGPKEPD